MFNSKIKLLVIGLLFIIGIFLIPTIVNAANENVQILQNSSNEYLIYIKGNGNNSFKFGFSNDKNAEPVLNKVSETDSESGEVIAYVDSTTISIFDNTTYMWAKYDEGEYILQAVEIDLSKAVKTTDLKTATKITKIIKADTSKTSTSEQIEGKTKITTTVGEVVLENGSYSYIGVKLPNSEDYNNFMKLATKISKINSKTDMYTQIEAYSEFLNLFNSLKPNAESGWVKADKNIIYQPEDAEDGEEYVLWIKDNNTEDIDVQFLISTKQESKEKIKETITTKLPVTYDNNILLVVFAILIVLIVAVTIRIKCLNKKEN